MTEQIPQIEESRSKILELPSLAEFERQHLPNDLSLFSKKEQEIIQRWITNPDHLSSEESLQLEEIKRSWWGAVYFDGGNSSREERRNKVDELYWEEVGKNPEFILSKIITTVQTNDTNLLQQYCDQYIKQFPKIEGALNHAIAFANIFKQEKELVQQKERGESISVETYIALAKQQYHYSQFLIEHAENVDILKTFWSISNRIALATQSTKELQNFRHGVLTQTAMYHLLTKTGRKPELANPHDDALHAIDMWEDDASGREHTSAIQIKSSRHNFEIVRIDSVRPPGVITSQGKTLDFFNTQDFASIQRFGMKVQEYEKRAGKKVQSYFVILPLSHIDPVTGVPDQEIVNRFGNSVENPQTIAQAA